MKIGITGTKGFIGQNLLAGLKKQDFKYVEMNCLDLGMFEKSGITHIVHLAGKTSVADSWKGIPTFLESNVVLASKILDFASKIGASVMLFSTYGYYPDKNIPPISPYHISKSLLEELAYFYNQRLSVPIHILRLASVYGMDQKKDCLIPKILRQILEEEVKEVVVDSLFPRRSYIDVRDIVEFIIFSLSQEKSKFNVSFLGSERLFSVQEVIETALEVSNSQKKYKGLNAQNAQEEEIFSNIQKNMALENPYGWKTKYTLKEGLRYLMENRNFL